MDAQGPERVRAYVEGADLSYPVLVDAENMLGGSYGFLAIPNAFIVDETGILRYQRLSTFTIKKPEIRAELEGVLVGALAASAGKNAASPVEAAAELFARGAAALRAGLRDEALELWRRAFALDPNNFLIRKQIWVVEHPEKFYPQIDFDWQKERLERGE